jgi:hypothetical protein
MSDPLTFAVAVCRTEAVNPKSSGATMEVRDIMHAIDATARAFKRDPAELANAMFVENFGDDEQSARVRQACSAIILREMECPELDQ